MSDIIAGDPAPTNPASSLDDLLAVFEVAGLSPNAAHVVARGFLSRHRVEVLAEAVKAANAEYEEQDAIAERSPYNEGVSDAVSALYRLIGGGESRG
ncbi:hypothetical protein ABZY44_21795 [Streptomyces sp. NPDC006544]|uniref:hypothetical protein n=1 Tax=Streptomyces sp. NPDC006544 TaxID=3154583 RepID=UPI0033AB70D7